MEALIGVAHKRSYPPRHNIIQPGDRASSIYLLLEGSVSIMMEDDNGREVVLAYLNAGEFFGEMGLFPEQHTRSALVRTRVASLVAEIGFEQFRAFAQREPDILFELAGQLAQRLRATSRQVGDLVFVDVSGRIAAELLKLAELPDATTHPRGTLVRVSRQELSRRIGCSREMAGRILKKLEEDGVVSTQGRALILIGHQRGNSGRS